MISDVQYQETFVEISTAAVPAMRKELGDALDLEQGARLTELDKMPDMDASPKGPPADAPYRDDKPRKAPRDAKPDRSNGKKEWAKSDKPKSDRPHSERPKFDKPKYDKPKYDKPKYDRPKYEKPKSDRSKSDGPKSGASKSDRSKSDKPKFDKPKFDKPKSNGSKSKPVSKDRTAAPKGASSPAPKTHRKGAADPSKPMGARKARNKGKDGSATPPARVKPRASKGPNARPMRKS